MKYWKEEEISLVENMEFWKGEYITKLEPNEIFVMGTNPSGIHGAGAAKAGLKFGAKMTVGRGLMGSTYGLITKNLEGKAGFVEKATGIVYDKEGYRSVSTEQIRANIDEMYDLAKQPEHQNKKFLVSYQYESWPNGSPKKSLNGYTSQEMLEMFAKDKEVPPNIVFHESYKPHLEKLYQSKNKVVVSEENRTYSKPNVTNPTNNTPAQSIVGNKFAKDVKVEGNLLVVSPQDNVPEGFNIINTTSRDTEGFGKNFSPFLLKNIPLYDGMIAKNMENAWQYAKVYKDFLDENGNPSEEYFKWAKDGWDNFTAVRYPNGKGAKAEYSYWETKDDKGNLVSHKWDYVTARKNIYIPLYAKAISQTKAFKELQQRYDSGEKIALWDFDGYNHYAKDMSFESVVHDQKRCGHAFVLYGLLKGYLKIISNELIYDFDLKIQSETPSKKISKSVAEKKDSQSTDIKAVVFPNELKNLYPSVYSIMSLNFVSIDHFMAYSKAKNSGDHESARLAMLICEEPFIKALISGDISHQDIATNKDYQREWLSFMNVIKALSTEIQGVDNNIWKSQAPALMKIAMKAKFEQNPDMQDIVKGYIKSLKKEDIDNSIINQYLRDVSKEISVKRKPKM